MRRLLPILVAASWIAVSMAQTRATLDLYLIDVEGGNATLLIGPSGESILIDTGNGGQAADRDATRIMAAVTDARLSQIDHLVTTHYHGDHFGAMTEVATRVPIRNYVDHGPNAQPNPATDTFLNEFIRRCTARPSARSSRPVTGLRSRASMSAWSRRLGVCCRRPWPAEAP